MPGSNIGVVYRLPENWNGKMVGLGGGGWAGNVRLTAAMPGLKQGYATAQTDTGHPLPASAADVWRPDTWGTPETTGRITTMATGPDPSLFYFRLIDTTGVHSFYAVPVTGGTPRLLLRLEEKSRQAARIIFSTDSRRLYFTLTDAESDIWVMTLQHP